MQQGYRLGKAGELAVMGFLSAILLLGQLGMSFLPNIEPVTCLIMIYTLVYKKRVFFMIYAFAFLEGLIFGFGIWWMSYLYIWSLLAVLTLFFQNNQSVLIWAVIAGSFGLLFGALCAIPYFFAGGLGAAFAYWSAGIPYDVIHCVGNFVITLVIFRPVYGTLKRLLRSQQAVC